MSFQFKHLFIPEVQLIVPRHFSDNRGYFLESYKKSDFMAHGILVDFVQDNHSFSSTKVIRGLHYQNSPHAQGKLVSVISGKIFDVAVDIRPGSDTYGKWVSSVLTGEGHEMLWIPAGFAHGFQALSDSHVIYKVTSEYDHDSERGIIWNDESIGVKWPMKEPILSQKDLQYPILSHTK